MYPEPDPDSPQYDKNKPHIIERAYLRSAHLMREDDLATGVGGYIRRDRD